MVCQIAKANDAKVLAVDFYAKADNLWRVKVTVNHADTGWKHYADAFQVEDAKGTVLGSRLLQHPHVDEQPFTRELAGVKIPKEVTIVYIKAHDKVHGWTKQGLKIDLTLVKKGYLRVMNATKAITKSQVTSGFCAKVSM